MANPNSPRRHRRLFYLAIALALVVLTMIAGRGAGRWLVREDPLVRSDVIVVLGGNMPFRAEEGARLFKMGDAPEVWLTSPENPSAHLKQYGIQFIGEEEYSRQVLIHEGTPASSVRILDHPAVNTEQEIGEITAELRRTGKTSVIIVSSPQHTRRIRTLWNELAGNDLHATVRAAFQDPYDPDHWWHNTRDTFAVFRELLGLVNAWTGLPVRPNTT